MFQYDLFTHYAAGLLAQQGLDFYDIGLLQSMALGLGFYPGELVPFPYPPWAIWVYYLLSLIPFGVAQLVWLILNLTAVGISAWSLSLLERESGRKWAKLDLILALICFFPIGKALLYGQVVPALLLAVVVGMRLLHNGRAINAGIILSLTLLKPHIFSPFILCLVVGAPLGQGLRLLNGVLLGFLAQMLLTLYLVPNSLVYYANWLPAYQELVANWWVPSLGGLVGHLMGDERLAGVIWIIGGIGSALGAWLLRGRVQIHKQGLMLFLPLAVFFAPYSWTHDFMLLLLPFLSLAGSFRIRMRHIFLLAFLLLNVAAFYDPRNEYLLFWVPILLSAWGVHQVHRQSLLSAALTNR